MDTLSLIYFSEAAKDLNFTKTAQRLFISQQTLSNHIARLEETFQVQLFDRKPRLMLTDAGETLLDFARQYKIGEENMRARLTDIAEKKASHLRIGCSPHRTRMVMPYLVDQFSEQYPNVQIDIYNYHSSQLIEMILNGEVDCAIAINKSDNPLIYSTSLFTDHIYLMVSRHLLERYYKDESGPMIKKAQTQGADLQEFQNLPFLDIRSAKMVRDVFQACNINPRFSVTLNSFPITGTSFFQNTAASIITATAYMHMRDMASKDTLFFRVNTPPALPVHDISFIRLQKKHMSKYGRYFQQLAMDYFDQMTATENIVRQRSAPHPAHRK